MADIQFRQLKDFVTQEVKTDVIQYNDANGEVWAVPQGHRFWSLYQDWLAQGNTPLPPT
ncbi:hypothetical protein [Ralstonia pickettii]|uniref:hypothetical protein n=1 Tax=Ralstonia pickettii TaxID=329 RepID=UPI000B0DBF20|nr:hypothetical protein [Ralstonia pickettii]